MDVQAVAQRAWDIRVNLLRVAQSILHHHADAEDAVSSAMINACRQAHTLEKPDRLDAWLMRILVRCCYDTLRTRRRELPTEALEDQPSPALLVPEGSVLELIDGLPESYRRVLILHYYEGFKAREIAGILGMPLGTVLVKLSRGRSKLKTIMTQEEVVHGDEQTV